MNEFTTPGVYVADALDGALYYHATATKFTDVEDEHAPYVRFVFIVEARGKAKRVKSYGSCRQHIFHAADLVPIELLVFRGWSFCDAGEKVMTYSPHVECSAAPIPPPPPVVWRSVLAPPDAAGHRRTYFWNTATGEVQWAEPAEPFTPHAE